MKQFCILLTIITSLIFTSASIDIAQNDKTFLELDSLNSELWTPIDPNTNNSNLTNAINEALQTLSEENGPIATGNWTVSKIIEANCQVSNGTNYQILAELVSANQQTMYMLWYVYQPPEGLDQLQSYQIIQPNMYEVNAVNNVNSINLMEMITKMIKESPYSTYKK